MDRWSAEWLLANQIAPTGMWAGRRVVSARLVFE